MPSEHCPQKALASLVCHARPIPAPPRLVPFTRETWPGWRYVKYAVGGEVALPCGLVSDKGVYIQGTDLPSFKSWDDLTIFMGSNHHNGPWEPLSTVEQ